MQMKHSIKLLTLLLAVIPFISCSSSDNDGGTVNETNITCSLDHIAASAYKKTYNIDVTCSRGEWTAYASPSDWMTVSVSGSNSKTGTVAVTVSDNTTADSRTGEVIVKSGTTRYSVPVTQAAPLKASASNVEFMSKGESKNVAITGNNNWTVSSSESWLTATKNNDSGITLTAVANQKLLSRTAKVIVTEGDGSGNLTINVSQESMSDENVTVPEGYKLVWHDEFTDGTTLNNDWTHEVQSSGWVNNELQNYINSNSVTNLSDGKLNITCYKGSDGKIYSGRVYAKVNTGWKYGYFEARIKLPKGKGTWPAFWMMPANNDYSANPWPGCGEIDIMEEVGVDANNISSTIHCSKYNNSNTAIEHASKLVDTAESEYHVYACEWTSDFISFMIDGVQILKYSNQGTKEAWPFNTEFYPILNLAWGGAWGGYKGVDETALPTTMKVDYIRVFQK
jgi:beta-glucanase (GH16 family)